jgi:hypothetical protein
VIRILEQDVRIDDARGDMTRMPGLESSEPGAARPVHRTEVDVIAVADDPNDPRALERPIAPLGRDQELVRSADISQLCFRPCTHLRTSDEHPKTASGIRTMLARWRGARCGLKS